MEKIGTRFRRAVDAFAEDNHIPVVRFGKGDRKIDVMRRHVAAQERTGRSGVAAIGVAQEYQNVFVANGRQGNNGVPWFSFAKAERRVSCFYFYLWDVDFGPAFIKICAYFPYPVKVWINGNEWAKHQATKAKIGFTALGNGFATCVDPDGLQAICDRLGPGTINVFFARWMSVLPLPLTLADRDGGYWWELSMRQIEVSRTMVFDVPRRARGFFEALVADNLDAGRPNSVELIFTGPRRTGRRPTLHRVPKTKIVTRDTDVTVNAFYKHSRIKQYRLWRRAPREGLPHRFTKVAGSIGEFRMPCSPPGSPRSVCSTTPRRCFPSWAPTSPFRRLKPASPCPCRPGLSRWLCCPWLPFPRRWGGERPWWPRSCWRQSSGWSCHCRPTSLCCWCCAGCRVPRWRVCRPLRWPISARRCRHALWARRWAYYIAGNSLGGMTGCLVAGLVADVAGWRVGIVADAGLAVVCTGAIIVLLPRSRRFQPQQLRIMPLLAGVGAALADPALRWMYAVAALIMGTFVGVYNFLGFRLIAAPFHVAPALVALLFITYAVGSVTSPLAGRLAREHGRPAVLTGSISALRRGLMLAAWLPAVLVGLVLLTGGFCCTLHGEWLGGDTRGRTGSCAGLRDVALHILRGLKHRRLGSGRPLHHIWLECTYRSGTRFPCAGDAEHREGSAAGSPGPGGKLRISLTYLAAGKVRRGPCASARDNQSLHRTSNLDCSWHLVDTAGESASACLVRDTWTCREFKWP